MYCKKCGTELNEGATFCTNCGAPVETEQQQQAAPAQEPAGAPLAGKDKTTMILLCLFLGGIGIHNFVMGESKKGIIKIVLSFCFGISGILALIELIQIAMDKYVVDPNKYFSF